jgi:hypothetical protein
VELDLRCGFSDAHQEVDIFLRRDPACPQDA